MKKQRAIELINRQLNEISLLKTIKEGDKEYQEWKENTLVIAKK